LGEDEEFISGDYKASTDNLHSWVSECLLDELGLVLTENLEKEISQCPIEGEFQYISSDILNMRKELPRLLILMKRALTGHLIMNPTKNESYREGFNIRDSDFRTQKEGQLMGSIISFPFLCLANAALCRYAMEITDCKNYKLVDRFIESYTTAPLLINGDDCLFKGKVIVLFDNWKKITHFGGLESSVGKTFRSRKFMTINSTQYSYKEVKSDWELESGIVDRTTYETVKYVNLGLCYQQKKDGTRGKPFYRLGAVHRDLQKTCPPELFARASLLFLSEASKRKFRKEYIKKDKKIVGKQYVEVWENSTQNAALPLFIPEWLGGLGLQIFPGMEKNWISRWDLQSANFIRMNMGSCLTVRSLSDFAMWRFHHLYRQTIGDFTFLEGQNFKNVEFDGNVRTLQEQDSKLYALSVVDILLKMKKEQLHCSPSKEEKKILMENYKENCKLWSKVRCIPDFTYQVDKLQPMGLDELLYEKKEFSLSCFDCRLGNLDRKVGIMY
jgi:hypothetical protein